MSFNRTFFVTRPDVLIVRTLGTRPTKDQLRRIDKHVRRAVRHAHKSDTPIVLVTDGSPENLSIGWL